MNYRKKPRAVSTSKHCPSSLFRPHVTERRVVGAVGLLFMLLVILCISLGVSQRRMQYEIFNKATSVNYTYDQFASLTETDRAALIISNSAPSTHD